MAGRVGVPVAVRQHARVRRHVEEARHGLQEAAGSVRGFAQAYTV